jgi:hypothetical protein
MATPASEKLPPRKGWLGKDQNQNENDCAGVLPNLRSFCETKVDAVHKIPPLGVQVSSFFFTALLLVLDRLL